jgi:hypothetical protein
MTNERPAPTLPEASTFEQQLEDLQVALAALQIVIGLCSKLGANRTAAELVALRGALMHTLRGPLVVVERDAAEVH